MTGWTETVPGVWTKVFGERLCVVSQCRELWQFVVFSDGKYYTKVSSNHNKESAMEDVESRYGVEEIECGDGSVVVMSRDRTRSARVVKGSSSSNWYVQADGWPAYGSKETALSAARNYVIGGAK